MRFILHIYLSLFLIYIGEYTFLTLFQVSFLITFLNFKLEYFLFIPLVLLTLSNLFSTSYFFYYIALLIFVYYLYHYKLILNLKELLFFVLYLLVFYFLYLYFKEALYYHYIDYGFNDKYNHVSDEVFFLLTSLHLLILFLLGYNREKIYRM